LVVFDEVTVDRSLVDRFDLGVAPSSQRAPLQTSNAATATAVACSILELLVGVVPDERIESVLNR
jgi:hypothetical protein